TPVHQKESQEDPEGSVSQQGWAADHFAVTRDNPHGYGTIPHAAYKTVCGVNGPLVVLDNVKVGAWLLGGDEGTPCSGPTCQRVPCPLGCPLLLGSLIHP
uniref:Uncharacterized protein n=1 Tax=Amazona collaria TaxID=241587 RepID=A0A8B9G4A7_9PSIT